jgi:hypothetical protein
MCTRSRAGPRGALRDSGQHAGGNYRECTDAGRSWQRADGLSEIIRLSFAEVVLTFILRLEAAWSTMRDSGWGWRHMVQTAPTRSLPDWDERGSGQALGLECGDLSWRGPTALPGGRLRLSCRG